MAGIIRTSEHGVMLAIGIVLLWFGGACLFVAFMSGQAASLTVGTDQHGKPIGPRNVRELWGRISKNVQAAEGADQGGTGVVQG